MKTEMTPVQLAACAVYPTCADPVHTVVDGVHRAECAKTGVVATLAHRAIRPDLFPDHPEANWRIEVRRKSEPSVLRYGNMVFQQIKNLPNMERKITERA